MTPPPPVPPKPPETPETPEAPEATLSDLQGDRTDRRPAEEHLGHAVQLSANAFYWGELDGSLLPRGRRAARTALGYLFESVLPTPLESVHSIYVKAGEFENGAPRYVACGMDRKRLQAHIDEHGDGLLQLGPNALPEWIEGDVEPKDLNLLSGPFEPAPVARLRRRWLGSIAALIALTAGALIFGAWHRTISLETRQREIHQATEHVYKQVFGAEALNSSSSQPSALRLVAERRRLQRTRQGNVEQFMDRDAAVALAGLLQHWPNDLHQQTQSIIVTGSSITVRAQVPSSDDAQRLANALGALNGAGKNDAQANERSADRDNNFRGQEYRGQDFRGRDFRGRDFRGRDFRAHDFRGWRLEQPRMNSTRGRNGSSAVQVTLRLKRMEEAET